MCVCVRVFAWVALGVFTPRVFSSLNACICLYSLVFVFVSMFVDNTVGHQGGIGPNVRKQLI